MSYHPIEIHVETLSDGTRTVAKVRYESEEFTLYGSGSSSRMPDDINDPELGRLLASKRALENLVESLGAKTRRIIEVNDKKAKEAVNYRTREEWEEFNRAKAMERHPAGKRLTVKDLLLTEKYGRILSE